MEYTSEGIQKEINALMNSAEAAKWVLMTATDLESAHAIRFMNAIDEAVSRERRTLEQMWKVARHHELNPAPARDAAATAAGE
jgi:hypothetical protein